MRHGHFFGFDILHRAHQRYTWIAQINRMSLIHQLYQRKTNYLSQQP